MVLMQPNFTFSKIEPPTAQNGYNPRGIVLDRYGNLYVADEGNARVLGYSPPFSNGMAASTIFGQPSFTTDAPGGEINQMNFPTSLTYHKPTNTLWVCDYNNFRVLRFSLPVVLSSTEVSITFPFRSPDFILTPKVHLPQKPTNQTKVLPFKKGSMWELSTTISSISAVSVVTRAHPCWGVGQRS